MPATIRPARDASPPAGWARLVAYVGLGRSVSTAAGLVGLSEADYQRVEGAARAGAAWARDALAALDRARAIVRGREEALLWVAVAGGGTVGAKAQEELAARARLDWRATDPAAADPLGSLTPEDMTKATADERSALRTAAGAVARAQAIARDLRDRPAVALERDDPRPESGVFDADADP